MALTLEEAKLLVAVLGITISNEVLEQKANAEKFKERHEKATVEAGKKAAEWLLRRQFDELLKRAQEAAGKLSFGPAFALLDEAEPLLLQSDEDIQKADRKEQAKILRQAVTSYPIPNSWIGTEADAAREIVKGITPLLADEIPTRENLNAASDFYDRLPAAFEAAKTVAAGQAELQAARQRLREGLTALERVLSKLPAKTGNSLREAAAKIDLTTKDPAAVLGALEAAETSLVELEGKASAASKELEKQQAEFKAELGKLQIDGKALEPAEAEAILESFDPDELADLRKNLGLESLAKLNKAFRAPDAPKNDKASLVQLKAFITEGVGGGANLKTLLATGFDNDTSKLAAFSKTFSTESDRKSLGRLMGVGKKADEKSGKLQADTVAVLVKNGCGGRAEVFKGLTGGMSADSAEAEAERERMRKLLEDGGFAKTPAVLGALVPPEQPEPAPDDVGKKLAGTLNKIGKAFEGDKGPEQFKLLLNSGFVPDTSKPANERVSPACLALLLRTGCDGDATKLAKLAEQLDTADKVAKLEQEIVELGKRKKSAEEQSKTLNDEADGLTGKNNANRRSAKRKQATTADERAQKLEKDIEAKQKEKDTLAAAPANFKNLLTEGGLGKRPAVLAQTFKNGCDADSGKLIAVSHTFAAPEDQKNLKAMIEKGGLGGGANESPELLGDLLKTGLKGDPEKLKDLGSAFNPPGASKMPQLKEIVGVYGSPPHGPPPDGPGKQIDGLLGPKILNGDVKKLQTKFGAKMSEIPDEAKRKKAIEWAPRYKKEAVPSSISDNEATSGPAKAASGKQTFRQEHCLKRHRVDSFDFSDIKADNTQWPPTTSAADLKTYMNTTLEQFATAPAVAIDPTQKVMLVTLGGGKKIAVQISWNATRITQFFPLAFPQAQGSFPTLKESEYLPDVVNFRQSEMEKIRDALTP